MSEKVHTTSNIKDRLKTHKHTHTHTYRDTYAARAPAPYLQRVGVIETAFFKK